MKMALRNSNPGKTRRHLVGPSILALTLFGVLGAAHAQTAATAQPALAPAGTTQAAPSPFGPLKHVNAGLLDVAYAGRMTSTAMTRSRRCWPPRVIGC